MAQERIETRLILKEGETAVEYAGPLTLRVPAVHLEKFLEERVSLGRRLAVLLLNTDSQWQDALKRLRTWNSFNASELGRFIASPEAVAVYEAACVTPDVAATDRKAAYLAAVNKPLGVLIGLYRAVTGQ